VTKCGSEGGDDKCCNCSQQTSKVWRAESVEKKGRKGKAGASFAGGQEGICPHTIKMDDTFLSSQFLVYRYIG